MIAFFQTGGIGDTILGLAVFKHLVEEYGDVAFLHYNHMVPQVIQGNCKPKFIRKMTPTMCKDMDAVIKFVPEVDMVVFNKFRKDHEGKLNFFCPTSEAMNGEARMRRETYNKNFMNEYGLDFGRVDPLSLMNMFNSETDYFSDWKRYGIGVGYSDVGIDIHDYTVARNVDAVSSLGKFAIVHDSKMPVNGESIYPLKAWYMDRWKAVCDSMVHDFGVKVVQIMNGDQEPFSDSVIPHFDVIGKDAMFQDYLYMLSMSSLYVGTDSWPAHAAIFIDGPEYILLKGAVSKRWDHERRFSTIIRKGNCQACEGPLSASSNCIWKSGSRECMDMIAVSDVMGAIHDAIG